MTRSTVLVTGGAGYIGSHAVLELMARGYRPVVLDNLTTGVREAVPQGVPFHQADVANTPAVLDVLAREKPDAVMHFAGSIIVSESVADPGSYYANNLVGCLALAQACILKGVSRFVFSSTAAVYGNPVASPVSEDDATAPLSPYGWSKLMAERVLFDLGAAHPGFRPLCLRYFNVAGADPGGRTGQRGLQATHLIRAAIETALGRRRRLEIFGDDYPTRDGTGERDFIHVSDLAAAHVAALAYMETGGESCVVNCGYGRGYTVREVIATLEGLIDRPIPVSIAPRRPGDAASVVANIARLRERLDWSPRYATLEQILSSALAWERSHGP